MPGRRILLFVFLVLANDLPAQEDFLLRKTEVGGYTKQLIGRQNDHVLLWKTANQKQFINAYDTTDLHLVSSAEIAIPPDVDEVMAISKIVLIGSVLKIVIEGHSADRKSYAFHVYDFGEKGIIAGSGVTIPVVNTGIAKRGIPVVKTNQEQNCLLVGWISTDKKRTSRNVEFSVLDEHSNIIHSRNHLEWSEFDRHVFKSCNLEVTNRRQVLIKVTRQEKMDDYYQEMLIVRAFSSNEQKDPVVSSFSLPKGTYWGQWFISEDDRFCRFFITCLKVTKLDQTGGITGIYRTAISEDGSLTDLKYSAYSEKTRYKAIAGSVHPDGLVPENYQITHALFDAQGNTYLLQERRRVTESSSIMGSGVGYDWYFGSILVSKFAPDGTFLWDHLVMKSQLFNLYQNTFDPWTDRQQGAMTEVIRDDGHLLSYVTWLENDRLKIIFNDLPENCDWDEKKERVYYKDPEAGIPFVVSVSPEDGSSEFQCHDDLWMMVAPYQFQYALHFNGWLYVPCKGQGYNQLVKVHY